MKVTVNTKSKKTSDSSFAGIELWERKVNDYHAIILRIGDDNGVVLHETGQDPNNDVKLPRYEWNVQFADDSWKRFEGTLEISND